MIQEQPIRVNGMTIIRWMCGVTRKDKIRSEHILGTTRVAQASKKITKRLLNWYGHVMRRDKGTHTEKSVGNKHTRRMERGRPKQDGKSVPVIRQKNWIGGQARRRSQRGGERRSSVIPATFQDGRIQWTEEEAFTKLKHDLFFSRSEGASPKQMKVVG